MKKILLIASFTLLLFQNCTKVDEKVYDQYTAKDFYALPVGVNAALAAVYAQVPGNWGGVGYAGADRGWYDLNEMSSDEQVVPHRIDGNWELDFARMYMREWLPSDQFVNYTWNWLYKSVYTANLAIDQLTKANSDPSKIAEVKTLRAFFYYLLIDDFGDVPFYTDNNLPASSIPQGKRADIFNFIVKELTENLDKLPDYKQAGNYYGRFTKMAGSALLAKVYLNAEVYIGTPKYAECMAACDKIINEGGYSLHPGGANTTSPLGYKYFELFGDVCPVEETILAIPTTVDVVGRNIFTVRSLRSTDGALLAFAPGGAWNGSIMPPDFVNKFNPTKDVRYQQVRFGSAPNGPRPAGFLEYKNTLSNVENPGAGVDEGARNQKFFPVEPANGGGASNDFPIFRYADILLMKAECLLRTSGSNTDANGLVTQVRVRAGLDPLPAPLTLMNIYDERGFELVWEGLRRQDMIRFGTFTKAHGLVPAVDDHFKIFPLPTSALNTNRLLKQNPGYN